MLGRRKANVYSKPIMFARYEIYKIVLVDSSEPVLIFSFFGFSSIENVKVFSFLQRISEKAYVLICILTFFTMIRICVSVSSRFINFLVQIVYRG